MNDPGRSPILTSLKSAPDSENSTIIILIVCISAAILLSALFLTHYFMKYRRVKKENIRLASDLEKSERTSRAKDSLLSRIAHEINHPMNAIIGMTELAQQNVSDSKKANGYIEKIALASKSLLSVIDDILDISAIEDEKIQISHESFDLLSFLSSVSSVSYMRCRMKGIKFDMGMSGVTENQLIGDKIRVGQILNNLLSNSIKFTPEDGEIRLDVSQIQKNESSVRIQFKVSDTGCGIPDDVMERIFKKFDLDPDSPEHRKHGGIGMSIVKNLADIMGGSIDIKSQKNSGTVFAVTLPFAIAPDSADDQKNSRAAGLDKINVLLADDDKNTSGYTSSVLERMNVKYSSAESAEETFDIIKKASADGQPFDLCFINRRMHDMESPDFARSVRKLCGDDTVIILLSEYDLRLMQDEVRDSGADRFIIKPVFESSILDALSDVRTLKNTDDSVASIAPQDDDLFEGRRILLAEDNEISMEISTEILEMNGIIIEGAENGKMALAKFKQSEPGFYDAVLMDMEMPKMDGYETIQAIRECDRPDAQTIPIISMIGGSPDDEDENDYSDEIAECKRAGADDHIIKPIDTMGLFDTLKKYI